MQVNRIEILNQLHKNYGENLLNYEKCKELRENLQSEKNQLEFELNFENTESSIGKILTKTENLIEKNEKIHKKSIELSTEIDDDLNEIQSYKQQITQNINKINLLECTQQYLQVIIKIEELYEQLEKEFDKNDDETCATIYANLCEINRILIESKTNNLKWYLRRILIHWHNLLKNKLTGDFTQCLKEIKWPFISTNFQLHKPMDIQLEKLEIIVEYLLQIQLPTECQISPTPPSSSSLLVHFQTPCLPIKLLIEPLRKRFIYHFYGTKQTNRLDKPEWYLTQILTWIRDHIEFVKEKIQPIVDRLGFHHLVSNEFMQELIRLAVEKLDEDLSIILLDDYLFSHTIDEIIDFQNELYENFNYPRIDSGLMIVLQQPSIFIKWLAMEKKYAMDKMDAILANQNEAFCLLTNENDEMKITTCADAFLMLLQTISERYGNLNQPQHRLQFLDLQLMILDDFRIRLIQLTNAIDGDLFESILPSIINTANYIEDVLNDWSINLNFLNLHYYKSMENHTKTDSVFDDTCALYRRLINELINRLLDAIRTEIELTTKAYRRELWSRFKVATRDFRSLSLTPSICHLYELLIKRLYQLENLLNLNTFNILWKMMAEYLDEYLFQKIIMDNRFNTDGALQFKYDILRNLIPIFAQYTEKSENYFIKLIEACNLLNLSKGSAILLRETLMALDGATGAEDTRPQTLKEIGVVHFKSEMALKILNQRKDITIDRLAID